MQGVMYVYLRGLAVSNLCALLAAIPALIDISFGFKVRHVHSVVTGCSGKIVFKFHKFWTSAPPALDCQRLFWEGAEH